MVIEREAKNAFEIGRQNCMTISKRLQAIITFSSPNVSVPQLSALIKYGKGGTNSIKTSHPWPNNKKVEDHTIHLAADQPSKPNSRLCRRSDQPRAATVTGTTDPDPPPTIRRNTPASLYLPPTLSLSPSKPTTTLPRKHAALVTKPTTIRSPKGRRLGCETQGDLSSFSPHLSRSSFDLCRCCRPLCRCRH
ncbi:hypothetical protein L484_012407 [Morus notabilis]|uniref:Uncharacterized protein n=1 Tax=Morus notabilis TaxID=981085 RepID=W9QEM8_9ROSA|nr:hypothetical protein L484_012407 [Morus notabilis]